jgi:SynChlorMet cassette radical SAM/SPASM protein ScmF
MATDRAVAPPLVQIYFYLVEGCNLACRHCWLSPRLASNDSAAPALAVSLFEKAILDAKPLGLRGVKLTGGEPLLHPQFLTLLDIVRSEGLELVIETNGVLCTPEIAVQIARSPVRHVSVSIDGTTADTHEWVRGIPGSFAQAQQAVRNLAAAGVRPQIIMSIMRHNAHQVDDMVIMAENLGAASVKFNIIQPTARGAKLHERDETLDIAELIDLGHHVDMELARRTPVQLHYDYPLAFRPFSRIARQHGSSVCGITGILGVLANGDYALCGIGEHIPELVFGRVGDSLSDIWRGHPILSSLRTNVPERLAGVCTTCLMRYQCLGSCIAQNYYQSGSLFSSFWFCELAKERGLFPRSRLEL